MHWPGYMGLPIRDDAETLVLKNEEYRKLVVSSDFRFHIFDLSKEEDRDYYKWVHDRIYAGMFTLIHKEHFWDKESQTVKVYMEWCQHYLEFSAEQSPQLPEQTADTGRSIGLDFSWP